MDKRGKYLEVWERLFLNHQAYLVSFAFRMTGSLAEAEDLAQETFLACIDTDPEGIANHKSWLTKICSNKALDHLKSAARSRETYHGTWLPDSVPDGLHLLDLRAETSSPEQALLLSESLTTSFLLLVEQLSPEERVVYLLSEVFDYSFREVASFLNKSEDACRKIAERARKGVMQGRPRFATGNSDAQELITRFFESAKKGDKTALVDLLADDSEFWSDGGGKVAASPIVLTDKVKIAAFYAGLGSSKLFAAGDVKVELASVNLRPGLIISKRASDGDWAFDTILSFEFKDGKIARIFAQRNPDKLGHLLKAARHAGKG